MAKRRLTLQQRRRISATQANLQASDKAENTNPGNELLGIVVARYGNQADVEIALSSNRFEVYRCHIRANITSLATGDKVTWYKEGDQGVIIAVHPRRSEIYRPDNRGALRTIAANIDHVGIVVAPRPELHLNLIDRYLVAAETCGIQPFIVCNKADLFDTAAFADIPDQLDIYQQLGYSVYFTSAQDQRGIEELAQQTINGTSVFVGQSGVGKSSIINQLCPTSNHSVGSLSEVKSKGTHTTTTTRLCHLPQGGTVIDSPGIREFGLWHLDQQQVEHGFIEFRPFLGLCKFRNCSHNHEKNCAILDAVANGDISEQRLLSYRHIINSLNA